MALRLLNSRSACSLLVFWPASQCRVSWARETMHMMTKHKHLLVLCSMPRQSFIKIKETSQTLRQHNVETQRLWLQIFRNLSQALMQLPPRQVRPTHKSSACKPPKHGAQMANFLVAKLSMPQPYREVEVAGLCASRLKESFCPQRSSAVQRCQFKWPRN